MSKKDVDNYYNEVCLNYSEMLEALRDMGDEASKKLISPEQLESMKIQVENIKTNYMRISYIMYLLNRPQKKSKQARYDKSKNKFSSKYTIDGIKEENKSCLDKIKL